MLKILKSVFWVGSATLFNLLVWVVSGKVFAVMLGPAGVGIFGLLRQLAQNLNVVATVNGANALIQGVASRSEADRPSYARHVGWVFLALTVFVGLGLIVGAPWLGQLLLGELLPASYLRWMLLPVVGLSLSAFFLGLLNGHRHLKALVLCQALGPIGAVLLVYPVVQWIRAGGTWAYVLMLSVPPTLVGLSAALVALRRGWLKAGLAEVGWWAPLRRDGGNFLRFSSALLIGGAASTGLQFALNSLVARRLGLAESGQFWVAWSLSMTYVTVLLSSLGAYYLPSLSSAHDDTEKSNLILTFTRIASIFLPLLIVSVIVLKAPLVRLMFSTDLLPSLRVFRWMLLGDFLKVFSWVWSFPMLANAESRTFATFEITTNGVWAALAFLGFHWFPTSEFLGMLFCGMYMLYASATLIYLYRIHKIKIPWRTTRGVIIGGLVVIWASLLFWRETHWNGWKAFLCLLPVGLHVAGSLVTEERRKVMNYFRGFKV